MQMELEDKNFKTIFKTYVKEFPIKYEQNR